MQIIEIKAKDLNETNFENDAWELTVTPENNWNGTMNIIISVSDGFNSAVTEFTLDVNPINDIPYFESLNGCTINFDEEGTTTYNLYIYDVDADYSLNVNPSETINYSLTTLDTQITGDLLLDQIIFDNW